MQRVKVKKIEIINFKGIEHLELDFTYIDSDRILDNIVFYGINGSGKRTILEAISISLLISSIAPKNKEYLDAIKKNLIERLSLGEEWVYNNKQQFQINLQLFDNGSNIDTTLIYNKDDGLKWQSQDNQKNSYYIKKIPFEYLSSYRLFTPSKVLQAGDWNKIEEIKKEFWNSENHTLYLQFSNNYATV